MKKNPEKKSLSGKAEKPSAVRESAKVYARAKPIPTPAAKRVKDFTYQDFRKIADQAPFTLSDWAQILHLSERTLQRYAAEQTAFHGLQVERILQMEKLIVLGHRILGKDFKSWLLSQPFSLGGQQPREFLYSYEGIQELCDLLSRIEHGIPA